jgi:hypothetical protein
MAENKETIFRKKALDQIRSPEQMNDYLKVTNPGVWIILAAAVLLFAGLFVWASIGKLETTAPAVAVIQDGKAKITLTGISPKPVTSDMQARIDTQDYEIATIEQDAYGRAVALAPIPLPDGTYDAKIILEKVSPISFLIQ